MKKILAQGAEAVISLENDKVLKERVAKGYRIKVLDEKLRKGRTKSEKKLLSKALEIEGVNVPSVFNLKDSEKNFKIEEAFVEGDRLSEKLSSYSGEKQFEVLEKIGGMILKLHGEDIIHGDLTTSNIILKNDGEVYLIDFGLGFISRKIEDKAVDLHLFKQALEAKHFQNWEKLLASFFKGYRAEDVIERLKKVEARGRYKKI
jgi:TP53 regulating kinase and related kinases